MSDADSLAAFRRGETDTAQRLALRELAAATAADDALGRVAALCLLARVALRRGDLAAVAERAREAAQLAESAGDRRLGRMPLHLRAVAARMSGSFDEARELYLESIALNEELGEAMMAAAEHRNLAYSELRCGETARARQLFHEAMAAFASLEVGAMAPYLEFDRATLASLDGDYEAAMAHLQAAKARWAQSGAVPDPDDAAEIAHLERKLAPR
jgi:tetratricopeptide (TPR) repeat protein